MGRRAVAWGVVVWRGRAVARRRGHVGPGGGWGGIVLCRGGRRSVVAFVGGDDDNRGDLGGFGHGEDFVDRRGGWVGDWRGVDGGGRVVGGSWGRVVGW